MRKFAATLELFVSKNLQYFFIGLLHCFKKEEIWKYKLYMIEKATQTFQQQSKKVRIQCTVFYRPTINLEL